MRSFSYESSWRVRRKAICSDSTRYFYNSTYCFDSFTFWLERCVLNEISPTTYCMTNTSTVFFFRDGLLSILRHTCNLRVTNITVHLPTSREYSGRSHVRPVSKCNHMWFQATLKITKYYIRVTLLPLWCNTTSKHRVLFVTIIIFLHACDESRGRFIKRTLTVCVFERGVQWRTGENKQQKEIKTYRSAMWTSRKPRCGWGKVLMNI